MALRLRGLAPRGAAASAPACSAIVVGNLRRLMGDRSADDDLVIRLVWPPRCEARRGGRGMQLLVIEDETRPVISRPRLRGRGFHRGPRRARRPGSGRGRQLRPRGPRPAPPGPGRPLGAARAAPDHPDLPVVVVWPARTSPQLRGFQLGANDYVAAVARRARRAHPGPARRAHGSDQQMQIQAGEFVLDLALRQARLDGASSRSQTGSTACCITSSSTRARS